MTSAWATAATTSRGCRAAISSSASTVAQLHLAQRLPLREPDRRRRGLHLLPQGRPDQWRHGAPGPAGRSPPRSAGTRSARPDPGAPGRRPRRLDAPLQRARVDRLDGDAGHAFDQAVRLRPPRLGQVDAACSPGQVLARWRRSGRGERAAAASRVQLSRGAGGGTPQVRQDRPLPPVGASEGRPAGSRARPNSEEKLTLPSRCAPGWGRDHFFDPRHPGPGPAADYPAGGRGEDPPVITYFQAIVMGARPGR